MSAIGNIYKKYGEIAGRQYLSIMYSTMLAMKKIPSESEKKEYMLRAQQYVRKEYGEAFLHGYDDFLRDENARSTSLMKELMKNESTFVIKTLAIDLTQKVVEDNRKDTAKTASQAPISNGGIVLRSINNQEVASQITSKQVNQTEIKKHEVDYKQEYRQSALLDNPFNLLNLKCDASRNEIATAVEEMDFVLGSEKCSLAQGILANPIKRLAAEMDWLPDTNDLMVRSVRACINEGLVIPLSSLGGISRLNALLFNFTLQSTTDTNDLCEQIEEIDKGFGELTTESTIKMINLIHEKAKMGQVSASDVEKDLNRKRDDIRRLLSGVLQDLPDHQYVQCATRLSESLVSAKGENGIIIADLVDQYEVWAQSVLVTKMNCICKTIDETKQKADSEERVTAMISQLIKEVKEWKAYAYPIEVRVGQTGIDNSGISNLAYKIRNLTIFLHNEKHLTDSAALLTSEMKSIFAELPEVLEKLNEDDETLQNIQRKKAEDEKLEAEHRQTDKLYTVIVVGTQYSVPPFCTCCMSKTNQIERVSYSYQTHRGRTRTTHTTSVNLPLCPECVNHRKKHAHLVIVLRCLSALIGIAITVATMILFRCKSSTAFFVGVCAAICSYFLIMCLKKTKPLPAEHSSRQRSSYIFSPPVTDTRGRILSTNSRSIRFSFTNWKYANLFKAANGKNAVGMENEYTINSAKSTSYFAVEPSKFASIFLTFLIFIAMYAGISAINQKNFFQGLYPNSPLAIVSTKDAGTRTTSEKNSTSSNVTSGKSTSPTNAPSTSASSNSTASSAVNLVTTQKTETVYKSTSTVGDLVYADVKSIFPRWNISNRDSYSYSGFVCECKTSADKTVWVYFTATQYKTYIDSSISTIKSNNASAETVEYSPEARIHGKVIRANSVTSTMSTNINSSTVIEFSSIDIHEQEKEKLIAYTIKTIEPVYSISSGNESTYHSVVCKCTYNNETKWIYIKVSDYNKYFDPNRSSNMKSTVNFTEKKLSTTKLVFGRMANSDSMADGLAKEIGQTKILVFESVR